MVLTKSDLLQRLSLAKKLGFHDDVKHWEAELAKMESNKK